MVPREQQGTRGGKEETGTGTETRAGTEMRMSTLMSTRAGIGTRTGAGMGTRIAMRVEGRDRLRTLEVVIKMDWKTQEGE